MFYLHAAKIITHRAPARLQSSASAVLAAQSKFHHSRAMRHLRMRHQAKWWMILSAWWEARDRSRGFVGKPPHEARQPQIKFGVLNVTYEIPLGCFCVCWCVFLSVFCFISLVFEEVGFYWCFSLYCAVTKDFNSVRWCYNKRNFYL